MDKPSSGAGVLLCSKTHEGWSTYTPQQCPAASRPSSSLKGPGSALCHTGRLQLVYGARQLNP